jgi:hypothetical protein
MLAGIFAVYVPLTPFVSCFLSFKEMGADGCGRT